MDLKRPAVLWSSIGAFLGFLLWIINLEAVRVTVGSGDSLRLLLVAVGTNLALVWTFFLLSALARRVGFLVDLTDHSVSSRASVIIIGILSALTGFSIGHLSIQALWGEHVQRSVERSMELNVTVVPIVLGILLMISAFIGLSIRMVRSLKVRKGIVFTLALIPATLVLVPRMFDEIALIIDESWYRTLLAYRGPILTPENEFTVVYVEQDVVDRGHLHDVVQSLLDQQPEDLVILARGLPESSDGTYRVSWHGIEPILSSPPPGIRVAVGHVGYAPVEIAILQSHSPRVAFRLNMGRMSLGQTEPMLIFYHHTTDPDQDLLTYLFQRASVPFQSSTLLTRRIVNVHYAQAPGRARRHEFDMMHVDIQRSGNSWMVEYDPQSETFRSVYRYKYDGRQRLLVPAEGIDEKYPSLTRLKGRRIIVDALPHGLPHWDNFLGLCFAAEVVNARHGLGLRYVGGWTYLAVTLAFHFLALFLFFRFRSVSALGILLLAHAGLTALLVVLFVEANILVSPLVFWVSTSMVAGILFINGFLREQRESVEERTRLATELNTARQMQLGLMPSSDPQVPGFDIAGLCRPANEVGGDFYAFVQLGRDGATLGIAVADVSGKAMKAAMTAVMTSGMLYEAAQRSASPREILDAINGPLHARSDKRVFTAMMVAALRAKGKRRFVTIANAGQTPPLLVHGGRVTSLKTVGVRLPLGLKDGIRYPERRQPLRSGDLVFLYTDGLTESRSVLGEQYGEERLQAYLLQHASAGSRAIVDGLIADVQTFAGEGPLSDDVTIVAVKVV